MRSFGDGASAYALSRPTYPEALFDWIAAEARGHTFAVDVAAGAGQGTRGLVGRFERVLATDLQAPLLAQITLGVEARVQAAEDLDVQRADVITTFQALHWFATPLFFERVRVGLKPGGLFVAVGYAGLSVDPVVDAVFTRFLAELEPHWAPNNTLLFRRYADVELPLEPVVVPKLEIHCTWDVAALCAYLETWSAVAKLRSLGDDPMPGLVAALGTVWAAGTRDVRMPLAIRAGRR